MLVQENQILDLIPQKPPMVMVDKLLHSDDKSTRSGLTITESNIFCQNGVFTEPGLMENIAQTVAAGAGYHYKQKLNGNGDMPIGYIGAIKDLIVHFLPKVNTDIETEVVLENEVMDISMISGKVFSNGNLAAECNMKIFIDRKGLLKL